MDKNYLVFEPMDHDFHYYETEKEALKAAADIIKDYDFSDDGIPEEYVDGELIVVKIIAKSKYTETDSIKNYACLKNNEKASECSICVIPEKECEGTEEWPHNIDFETVGDVEMNVIEDKAGQ